jgi:hypothetical protein
MKVSKQYVGLLVGLVALLALVGCEHDDPTGGGVGGTVDTYPSPIGALWKYEVVDYLALTTDTVWVSVIEQEWSSANTTLHRWRFYRPRTGETEDRLVSHELATGTVRISVDPRISDPYLVESLEFPMADGDRFDGGDYVGDTAEVEILVSHSVAAGTFRTVARVDRTWNPDFEGGYYQCRTWLAEEAGVLEREYLVMAADGGSPPDTTFYQTWELLSYDLTQFNLDQYPNGPSTRLTYQMIDDATGVTDTIEARVIGTSAWLQYDSLVAWEYLGSHYADTHFVAFEPYEATIIMDTSNTATGGIWTYRFPMTVGRHWGVDYAFITPPAVTDKAPLITPAGQYATAFRFECTSPMVGGWSVDEWIVPGVGLARMKFAPFVANPMPYQHWLLLDDHGLL